MALRVGVVGGGQLARMMIAPAVELGVELRVLAEDEGMSASLAASAVGDYRDADTVLAFARDVDVVTFDHEHVPQDVLAALVDAGSRFTPAPTRCASRRTSSSCAHDCRSSGCRSPTGRPSPDAEELQAFLDDHGGRAVVKTPRGGYDGKGVRVVSAGDRSRRLVRRRSPRTPAAAPSSSRSSSTSRANSPSRWPGVLPAQMQAYPVVETVQRDGVCAEVIAPAPHASERLLEVAAQHRRGHRRGPRRDRDAGGRAVRDHR